MKKVLSFLTVVFLCLVMSIPSYSADVGDIAPAVNAGSWLNVDSFDLSAHKQNKVVLVEFWATWCPPCRVSIPHLKKIYQDYKDEGLVIVSLSSEDKTTVEKFNKKAGMSWALGVASNAGGDYGVSGIPSAFVVAGGKIVWKGHPMDENMEATIKEQLKSIESVK